MHKPTFAVAALAAVITTASPLAQGRRDVRRAREPLRNQYIVVLAGTDDPEAVGRETEALSRGQLKRIYRSALRGFAIRLSEQAATSLAADPRVRFVEEDGLVRASQVQASPPWGLDRIDQRLLPLDRTYRYGAGSAQVTVHVLDSGVRVAHQEFGGRAFSAGDYVDDDGDFDPRDVQNDDPYASRPDGEDCNGHGTHVAGTIGGDTFGVAKRVLLRSHRVLGCDGFGSVSGLIAAIDAITERPLRPAVANMSVVSGPSLALDDAVRRSIAAGVTYVVAAGNDGDDARYYSPARVTEALTVGATTSSDARASFSNFGPALDVFAPGGSIRSASYAGDEASDVMSGTSMAAPHVTGVVAMYLERNPTRTPAQTSEAVLAAATTGRVTSAGSGSPNRLLYSAWVHQTPPAVTVVRPNGGERAFVGSPYRISWTASDADGISRIDVSVSTDGGQTYSPACTGLSGSRQSCTWTPDRAAVQARVRVTARDSLGTSGADISNGTFSVLTGTPALTVTSPSTRVNWGRGSTHQIRWNHNLGSAAYVRIELSRDGGATFPEVIAASVKNTGSTAGTYNWPVTSPNAGNAVVRVTWLEGSASDTSNSPFLIADPYVRVDSPNGGETWSAGAPSAVRWSSNLGSLETVRIELSRDGGLNYSMVLLASTAADGAQTLTPATTTRTSAGRIRVVWRRNTSIRDASNANFTIR